MSEQRRRWFLGSVGAVVALLVATGAVLPAEPFDAWTTVIAGNDAEGSVGEHGLDPVENERKRPRLHVRTIAHLRQRRVRPDWAGPAPRPRLLRWREARLGRPPTSLADRSPPGPDRAPPSS